MFGRSPAVIAAALAAIIQGIWIFVTMDVGAAAIGAEWLLPAITVLAGIIGGKQSVAKKTIREAGESPENIEARAKSGPRL